MAPSKTPAFAVCGGVSVETVVTGVGRRRNGVKTTRKSAVVGPTDSLYADLLWDCGGANVQNPTPAVGTASSTQAIPNDDFSDVFGGPPKFASISSQLSFQRGVRKVSNARSDETLFIESSSNAPTTFDIIDQTPVCIVQKTLENPTLSPSSAKSVKVRSVTGADISSRVSYSDSDNKCSLRHNGDIAVSEEEFSSTAPSGASSQVGTTSTLVRQRESSRFSVGEDTKRPSVSKLSRKDFTGMKENFEEVLKVPRCEQEGKLVGVHEKMTHFIKSSQDRKQKLGRYAQHAKAHRQNHSLKIKKDIPGEIWVSVKDVRCATEPSRFPPPSRPPPERRSDAACVSKSSNEATSSIDDWQNVSGLAFPKQSTFDSGSMSSCCTRELNTKVNSGSRVIEDAVEIAESKVKIVLEAREKAKLMVEKKLKEKRRAQQLKDRSARVGQQRAEDEFQGHMEGWKSEKRNSSGQSIRSDVNKLEEERARQRDIARRRVEKANRELQNGSVLSVQERLAELRFLDNFSKEPVEIRKEGHTSEVDVNGTTVHIEPTSRPGYFWFETSGRYQQQSACEDRSVKDVEGSINTPREQQQDSPFSSWCSTEPKGFCDDSSSIGFQEIMGETLERRMARWDRYCRTAARMARALKEKKQRDLERQKEQAERHRAAEMLDEEIKVWASGKEGNLEALLCSLHHVLWPENGWKGVSPADFSTTAAVKKAYRRAALCVHPDKMQQKGATVAQKYVAEKVFDLLREASANYVSEQTSLHNNVSSRS